MVIEKANSNDTIVLTELTKKSKAFWGYSDEQIEIWSEQLTISKAYIEEKEVYKLLIDGHITGYYSYFNEYDSKIRLDNLFILPDFIGKRLGKILMDDFLVRLAHTGAKKVILEAEPNAEGFYAKFGFVKIGEIETSIKNRYLPVMELVIE
jgi:ribosomal protein S18 acetylase RimI-like enzyme